ncbi:ferredoxin [Mycolicibacterium thermoresistibile]
MNQVRIDERCQGHGQCYQLFPQIFEPDDEGFGTVRADAVIDDDNLLADAIACCPEGAIVADTAG